MYQNKRKFKRYDISLNVQFKPSKVAKEYVNGIIRNFSFEGFTFVSQTFDFETKETIELEIMHPWKDKVVPVSGVIIWKRQADDLCLAGIKLKEMDEETKGEILDCAYYESINAKAY